MLARGCVNHARQTHAFSPVDVNCSELDNFLLWCEQMAELFCENPFSETNAPSTTWPVSGARD
jgi:hypothetical protein